MTKQQKRGEELKAKKKQAEAELRSKHIMIPWPSWRRG
jgi:hypothetical protein